MNRKEYHADYWKKHGKEITEKRKERYRKDPEYREKAKQRSREFRNKIAKNNSKSKIEKIKKDYIIFDVILSNNESRQIKCYRLNYIAKILERLPRTILRWEENKKCSFPRAMYGNKRHPRLYTQLQVNELERIYEETKCLYGSLIVKNQLSNTNFFDRVNKLWKDHPEGI